MRTSRLRRWLLRGALLSAAVAPLVASSAQADEWQWNDLPKVEAPADREPADEPVHIVELYEWQWN